MITVKFPTRDDCEQRSFTLTPGKLDTSAQEAFTRGLCYTLALALHERTKWPIVVLMDANPLSSTANHIAWVSTHAGVMHPDGWFVDIHGVQPFDHARKQWGRHFTEVDSRTIKEIGQLCTERRMPIKLARTFVKPLLGKVQHEQTLLRHHPHILRQWFPTYRKRVLNHSRGRTRAIS